jgi:O-acetyl-ADP-ribose deacetylase (regulator of RNase III)
MTQNERLLYLINELKNENSQYSNLEIPSNISEQKMLLRSLMNVRMANPISEEFLSVQDEYLQEEIKEKGITDLKTLTPIDNHIYLWQGDITTLKCDAIVNACNSQLLGCFYPCHSCIDNAIHTYSGIQLRLACNDIMKKQGYNEPTGRAKITPAFNLPCKYVIHTVGPIVQGRLTKEHCSALKSCYYSSLELADNYKLKSIAFCCISTGEFHFPNDKASQLAVNTVREYKSITNSNIEVIFNVFKDTDYQIYKKLLN